MNNEQWAAYKPTSDERTMAILSHILTVVFPLLAPLIIWLIKKDESKWVAEHAKESLNFQITVVLVCIALAITIVGLLVIWAVGIAAFIFVILATVAASENKMYRYPVSIRFIK